MRQNVDYVTDEVVVDRKTIEYGTGTLGESQLAHSQLFGELAKLALPVVKHYHCDLYNDVKWIQAYVPNQLPSGGWPDPVDQSVQIFYYGVRETGTSIGDDLQLVGLHNEQVYMVTVRRTATRRNDYHDVTITRLKRR